MLGGIEEVWCCVGGLHACRDDSLGHQAQGKSLSSWCAGIAGSAR